MNRLDRERIATLVGEARRALGQLRQHEVEDKGELLASEVKLGNIKYQFIVAIESCIDICTHIVAKSYIRAPESYAGCFELLAESGSVGSLSMNPKQLFGGQVKKERSKQQKEMKDQDKGCCSR